MIGTIIAKKKIYAAYEFLNKRDVHSFISAWDDDAIFVFPGTIRASGSVKGKKAIETWFHNFCSQFPEIHFKVKRICAERLFDMIGTNVLTAIWDIILVNKDRNTIHNSGVTVITLKRGKVIHAQDYIFNTGKEFNAIWGE
ncbi:MAG: nuclear transport factor 2 family protein [Nitrospirota bacterium]